MTQILAQLAEQLYQQSLLIVSLQERIQALEKTHPDIEAREVYLRDAKQDYETKRSEARSNYEAMKRLLASIRG